MTSSIRTKWLALVGGVAALGLAYAPSASANIVDDEFRTGGCSGCFNAQVQAALNNFATLDKVWRGCGTGGGFGGADSCDGSGGGDLLDFVVLVGDLRNSNTDPDGFGVPGGASDVTFRVSANGSSNGIRCANDANPQGIGFLALEGFDGASNTADDAGGSGTFEAFGAGDPGNDATTGTSDDEAAPLVACDTSVGDGGDEFELPSGTVKAGGFVEGCVVQFDFLDSDGQIDNDRRGVVPGTATTVGGTAGSETFNLQLQCDTGFADLPTKDFAAPTLASQDFADGDVFGAQIFKFITSDDVHAIGDPTQKIAVNDPQVEGIFSQGGAESLCNWEDLGADADSGSASSGDDITVCFRAPGSGTKETFRNTWMTNVGGDKEETTGSDLGTDTNCLQAVEGGGFRLSTKTADQGGGNGDVITCVETHPGAIGYVDAADTSATDLWHSIIVEGVDPDSNDLRLLTKCGHYRWWGPLSGGRPNDPGLSDRGNVTPTVYETAHRNALRNPAAFASSLSYLPLDGAALTKNVTDGAYSVAFAPTGCPAVPVAPAPIP